MNVNENLKPIPRTVLVFGAGNHIGTPLVRHLRKAAPQIKLRLVSSRPEGCEALRQAYPDADVVSANFFDRASLDKAVEGMEGVFVNPPPGMNEREAMPHLIGALKQAGTAIHILRTVGLQPEANVRRYPESIRKEELGLPIQHPIVKRLFDESDLPVTYMNFGATFLDNFFWMRASLVTQRKLIWHNRLIPFIDPRDIGEVAARLLLSDNHRHIGQFHTLNNGHDLMRFSDVAEVMTEVFGEKITHDGTKEGFLATYGDFMGPPVCEMLWDFFEYERANEVVWSPNTFVERMLGRKPTTVRQWLEEHKAALLAPLEAPAGGDAASKSDNYFGDKSSSSAAAPSNIDGTWDCVVSTPGGKEPHELVMTAGADGSLQGRMTSPNNGIAMPLENGRRNGNELAWEMVLAKPIKMKLKVSVTVSGNELSGKAAAGMIKVPIQGTRRGA